jgi:hypothetical protein
VHNTTATNPSPSGPLHHLDSACVLDSAKTSSRRLLGSPRATRLAMPTGRPHPKPQVIASPTAWWAYQAGADPETSKGARYVCIPIR